ncbi:hypothetical protein C0989_006079 [Termitomyces sp. Mn162]|nr:hypothetical protein C0989_006079 [Termitomyces sp. Mn162]
MFSVKEELEENKEKEASLSSPTVALQEAKEEQENDRLQATLKEQETSFSVALKEANDRTNEVMDALQQEKNKIQATLAEKEKLYNAVLKGAKHEAMKKVEEQYDKLQQTASTLL